MSTHEQEPLLYTVSHVGMKDCCTSPFPTSACEYASEMHHEEDRCKGRSEAPHNDIVRPRARTSYWTESTVLVLDRLSRTFLPYSNRSVLTGQAYCRLSIPFLLHDTCAYT